MNEPLKTKMQKDLIKTEEGIGGFAGLFCFGALSLLGSFVPGVPELVKDHTWPWLALAVVSAVVGWAVGLFRHSTRQQTVWAYDDETLKYEHDRLRESHMRSYVIWCIAIGLAIGYFILK